MHIHLVGVGGVAMGNLAAMLQAGGHTVSGSDHALYPPMSDKLREWGIDAHPFDAANLQRKHPDLCIIGNAISRGNVEVEYILNERLPYTSMAAALFDFFLKDKQVIVIAGTHGKTTTTFLMDHVLSEADRPPGLFAGGVRADGMNGFRVSDSQYFVIEGDEYDTAFFDKAAKFLHYRPKYLILTSVEFDHADIYENKRAYQKSFQHLLRLVPGKGSVIAAAEDRGVRQVLRDYHLAPIHWYASERFTRKKASALREIGIKPPYVQKENRGVSNDSPIALSAFSRKARTVQFDWPGTIEDFALLGEHNTANAQAVSILAAKLGLDPERVRGALQNFPGVLRRQQVRLDLPAESTAAADAG
ncbi:MAG: hypothetical protein KDK34_01285, partial [Leptospiraceae bacterium]|nr:hypothetical protein [Leptospiraceae bacterium]